MINLGRYCMGIQKKKLKPHEYRLLRQHKAKVEDLVKIRKVVYAPWFSKRLGEDERLLLVQQMNLTKSLVENLNAQIELFRKENPKPVKD